MSDEKPKATISPFWGTLRTPGETVNVLSRSTGVTKPKRFTNLEVAKLLKEYRAYADLSQSRLAKQSGLDHSYISRLESGRQMPSRKVVFQLAKGFGFADDDARIARLLIAAGHAVDNLNLIYSCEEINELDKIYLDSSASVKEIARMFITSVIGWIEDLQERENR